MRRISLRLAALLLAGAPWVAGCGESEPAAPATPEATAPGAPAPGAPESAPAPGAPAAAPTTP